MNWTTESEFYESFGRFCVMFEKMCHSMESCIRQILFNEGLESDSVQEILLSSYTAEPLRAMLQNLSGEVLVKNDQDLKLCSKIFAHIQKIIKRRNKLVHSKWFPFGIQDDESSKVVAGREKLSANKKGVATKRTVLEKSELESFIEECKKADDMILLLYRCLIDLRKLDECFKIVDRKLECKFEYLKPIEINV